MKIKLSEFEPPHLNIGFTNLKGQWLALKKLASENGLTDPEFAKWFVSIFYGGIWKTEDNYSEVLVNELITETELYFKIAEPTRQDGQAFLNILGWHSLLYYQKCDKFKKLLYADIHNNSIIIYDPLSGIGEFLKEFKIKNGPSWPDSLSNSCFKLKSI